MTKIFRGGFVPSAPLEPADPLKPITPAKRLDMDAAVPGHGADAMASSAWAKAPHKALSTNAPSISTTQAQRAPVLLSHNAVAQSTSGISGALAHASHPFEWKPALPWNHTKALQAAWGVMTLLRPQFQTVVGLMLAAFPSNVGQGSSRIHTPHAPHAPHASLAHTGARGPMIEEVLPHQNPQRLVTFPDALPSVLRDLHRPSGFQQHEMLGNNFALPGRAGQPEATPTLLGRPAQRLSPEDLFHFARGAHTDQDMHQRAKRVDELLAPKTQGKRPEASLSPVALAELSDTVKDSDYHGFIIFPAIRHQGLQEDDSDLSRYGFRAEIDYNTDAVAIEINTQQATRNHSLGPLPPVDGDTVVNYVFTKLPGKPATLDLYPSELRIRHRTELAHIVNDAIYLDQKNHTQISAPIIQKLSQHIPALRAALDQGYELAGLFDESDRGPGLLLVKK